jgi:hypothetical protein
MSKFGLLFDKAWFNDACGAKRHKTSGDSVITKVTAAGQYCLK